MNVLSISWNFLTAHWQAILLVLVIAVGGAWIRHQQSSYANSISQLNAAHQTEIDKINSARALENTQHAAELKQLQVDVAKIQSDYDEAQKQLAAKQTQEQVNIVKQYGNDPVGLANLLSQKMGFTVQQ